MLTDLISDAEILERVQPAMLAETSSAAQIRAAIIRGERGDYWSAAELAYRRAVQSSNSLTEVLDTLRMMDPHAYVRLVRELYATENP